MPIFKGSATLSQLHLWSKYGHLWLQKSRIATAEMPNSRLQTGVRKWIGDVMVLTVNIFVQAKRVTRQNKLWTSNMAARGRITNKPPGSVLSFEDNSGSVTWCCWHECIKRTGYSVARGALFIPWKLLSGALSQKRLITVYKVNYDRHRFCMVWPTSWLLPFKRSTDLNGDKKI